MKGNVKKARGKSKTEVQPTQFGINAVLAARKTLEKYRPIPQDIAVDLDIAFLPVPPTMTAMHFAGELTHDRMMEWLERFAGFFMLGKMNWAWSKPKPDDGKCVPIRPDKDEEAKDMAWHLGRAFILALPGSPLLCSHTNPYISHKDAMQGILACRPDVKLLKKYHALFRQNGYVNPDAEVTIKEIEAERARTV